MKLNPFARSAPRVLIPQQIDLAMLDSGGEVHTLSGLCMGTHWQLRCVAPPQPSLAPLGESVSQLLERIENQMSHFRPHSNLRRFADLPAGQSLPLPDEFAQVLRCALEIARLSDGAFDPTLAAAVDAWGFGAATHFSDAQFTPPMLGTALADSAQTWKKLAIDAHQCIQQTGVMALNLSAIAKGFAVDAVADLLTRAGYKNHLVEIGGELRGTGVKPDGQPWWVALEPPHEHCTLASTRIALHGLSVATSGDYRRQYRIGQRVIHHTLDPRTGAPVIHPLSSVTVIHRECMLADAWATAMMVLGTQQGLALAENNDLCVLWQGRDARGRWQETSSTQWQRLLQ